MHVRLLVTSILLLLPVSSLFADIIITKDNMVLNGKIIEENKKTVMFGNYHGVFKIDRNKIKEIYRTDSYEADVKILNDKGRSVNKDEIKINYDSGQKKIKERESAEDGQEASPALNLSLSPYIIFNSRELGRVLPYSYGFSLTAVIPAGDIDFAKQLFISGLSVEADWLYSGKSERSVTGYRASVGPQWKFGLSTDIHLDWFISAKFGAGWYNVRGIYDNMNAVKWNAGIDSGPVFTFSHFTLSPVIRFDYIYDSAAPFYGIGAALSLGYNF